MITPFRVGLAFCIALHGCSPAGTSAEATTVSQRSSASQVSSSGPTTSTASSPSGLLADEVSEETAKAAAVAGMAAYARPDLPYDQWWAGLEPLLSGQAIPAYQTVDPVNIPVTRVTGEANLPSWDTPRIARVSVPTDAGVYLVIVSRNEADPVWRIERITPPEAR